MEVRRNSVEPLASEVGSGGVHFTKERSNKPIKCCWKFSWAHGINQYVAK